MKIGAASMAFLLRVYRARVWSLKNGRTGKRKTGASCLENVKFRLKAGLRAYNRNSSGSDIGRR